MVKTQTGGGENDMIEAPMCVAEANGATSAHGLIDSRTTGIAAVKIFDNESSFTIDVSGQLVVRWDHLHFGVVGVGGSIIVNNEFGEDI